MIYPENQPVTTSTGLFRRLVLHVHAHEPEHPLDVDWHAFAHSVLPALDVIVLVVFHKLQHRSALGSCSTRGTMSVKSSMAAQGIRSRGSFETVTSVRCALMIESLLRQTQSYAYRIAEASAIAPFPNQGALSSITKVVPNQGL